MSGADQATLIVVSICVPIWAWSMGLDSARNRLRRHHRALFDEWVEAEAERRGGKAAERFRRYHGRVNNGRTEN